MNIKKIRKENVRCSFRHLVFGLFFLCCFKTLSAQQYRLDKLLSVFEVPVLNQIKSSEDILEDKHGYIWISSINGLYKFDGYELTHYLFDPNKPGGIAGNWISGLAEDDAGNIWFSIFGIGLQKLDPVTGKFTLYKPDATRPGSLPGNRIWKVIFDKGSIWLPSQNGIARLDIRTDKFKKYSDHFSTGILAQQDTVWTLNGHTVGRYDHLVDSIVVIAELPDSLQYPGLVAYINNKLFISAGDKFYSYDIKSHALMLYNPQEGIEISGYLYYNNRILMATLDGKILSFDPATGLFVKYKIDNIYKEDQKISKFVCLKNGDIWLTGGDKVFKVVDPDKGFEVFRLFKDEKPLYSGLNAASTELEKGLLGIGFSFQLDLDNEKVLLPGIKYPALRIFNNDYKFEGDYTTIFRDSDGDCWFTYLQRSKDFLLSFYHLSHIDKKLTLLGSGKVQSGSPFGITKIGDDLWVAAWGGLIKFNIPLSKETVIRQGTDSLSLTSSQLRSVFRDKDDGLWVCSQTGLNYKRKNEDHFTHFLHQPGNRNSLSFDGVSSVIQDNNGLIWIATLGGGVNSYNIQTGKFEWYGAEQGLAENNVNNIILGDDQQVWVTHGLGISRIDPVTKRIENFIASDGVNPPFYESTATKMSDGSLIFEGFGFTRIRTDRIKVKTYIPTIHLVNFKLHNKDVQINGADSILHQNINVTHSLVLNYNQNVVSFQYAALDMAYADYRMYAYKLEGFDTAWQYVGNRREATFTNLSPGKYTLKIKSADATGLWQEMKDPLQITILPPWWKTWWAYTLYTLAFVSIVWAVIQYRSRKLKAENATLEIKVTNRTNELHQSLKELKEAQSQLIQSEKMASLGELTAGIAHEIQNPLNFVNNFSDVNKELLEELKQEADKGNIGEVKALADDVISNEEKINHHGKRADAIVKGMLQHSRTSNGTRELTDINVLCDEYLRLSYHGLRAKDKSFNATLKTDFDNSIGKINIIPQDIGRVIMNLLTNAFYAVNAKALSVASTPTAADYEPTVSIRTTSFPFGDGRGGALITVTDNGNGIPKNIIDKIFQPFFTTKPTGQGTGLGLSLSYDIITKGHGGELTVETTNEGTTFIIQLPISRT